jgi:hypothetical protein
VRHGTACKRILWLDPANGLDEIRVCDKVGCLATNRQPSARETQKVFAKVRTTHYGRTFMPETLGSLCDKLTIVKLKQWHTKDKTRTKSLKIQEKALQEEIDEFVCHALNGAIPENRLKFEANKVYKKRGNTFAKVKGDIGAVFSQLAQINCELWHEVEKSYNIDQVPDDQKSVLIKRLAVLNLERNRCMEAIDENLYRHLTKRNRAKAQTQCI